MTAPMSLPCRLTFPLAAVAVLALSLAACANKPASEMPAAAATAQPAATAPAGPAAAKPAAAKPAAEKPEQPPMDRAEANAQCWMKYDKTAVSLEAKAKLVDKCAAEKLQGK